MLNLEKDKMDASGVTIATDLELRAKQRTIAKLKRQGEQYRQLNAEIPYLMEPDAHKELLVDQLRQNAATKKAAGAQKTTGVKPLDLDVEAKEKIAHINRGLEFKRR